MKLKTPAYRQVDKGRGDTPTCRRGIPHPDEANRHCQFPYAHTPSSTPRTHLGEFRISTLRFTSRFRKCWISLSLVTSIPSLSLYSPLVLCTSTTLSYCARLPLFVGAEAHGRLHLPHKPLGWPTALHPTVFSPFYYDNA
eukprot:3458002-Pyramimonas_sp.AAC.2